jgi:protein-L-isoaspartate O-methyltransferase
MMTPLTLASVLRRALWYETPTSATRSEMAERERDLVSRARVVRDDWRQGSYYDEAEAAMDEQWTELIWPVIDGRDFSSVVEIGAGHGRNSEKLRRVAGSLHLVDINIENINFLKQRFQEAPNVVFVHNDGTDLRG